MSYKTLNLTKCWNIYRSRPLPYICRHFVVLQFLFSLNKVISMHFVFFLVNLLSSLQLKIKQRGF